MEVLVKARGNIKGSVTRILNYAENATDQTSSVDLKVRLDKLHSLWNEFIECEREMLTVNINATSDLIPFEDTYYKAVSLLTRLIRQPQQNLNNSFHENSNSTLNQSVSADIKLPRMLIPVFSGDFREWPSFYTVFCAAIHDNTSITPAQKFQYLRGQVKGEASELIQDMPISENSYVEAIQLLRKHYDRKKEIVNSFIDAMVKQPSIKHNPESEMKQLAHNLDVTMRGLKALGSQAESRDPWIIYIISHKLDPATQQKWADETFNLDYPTLQQFSEFLTKRSYSLAIGTTMFGTVNKDSSLLKKVQPKVHHTLQQLACAYCGQPHAIHRCFKFMKLDPQARRDAVDKVALCYNCLSAGHSIEACSSSYTCRKCYQKHHTLLHVQQSTTSQSAKAHTCEINSESNTTSGLATNAVVNNAYSNIRPQVLLPTAVVRVRDNTGNWQACRALLDSGSQASFISEKCSQRLGLQRTHAQIKIDGLSSSAAGTTRGNMMLEISSRCDKSFRLRVEAFILSKVTNQLPCHQINIEDWEQLSSVTLADQTFNNPGHIDILLGADVFFSILKDGQISLSSSQGSQPVAQCTVFGWVLAGKVPSTINHVNSFTSMLNDERELHESLQRFWEVEELPTAKYFTEAENRCESHFIQTYQRNRDGRYIVKLPFKDNATTLGNSKNAAISRLLSMERRFKSNETLKLEYVKFMKEYIELGHMQLIPPSEVSIPYNRSYYLPHHSVLKEASSTTKLRVVFDGSCKSSNGVSLNDNLLVGPTIQDDLFSLLLRFRTHTIAMTADVAKMYRQIIVSSDDINYQRIVWRESANFPIDHYWLTTITYGTASAPFQATRVLHQIAYDNQDQYPQAAKIIHQDFYVDDMMSGATNEQEAARLQTQIIDILQSGGFNLRKWCSNSRSILQNIPEEHRETKHLEIDDDSSTVKTLGIFWNPIKDCFTFKVTIMDGTITTKRRMLSESSKIFDPLGWLSPSIICIKILFQRLWLKKVSWDDPLPSNLAAEWIALRKSLPELENVHIPRWIFTNGQPIQLHGFSDASEFAYGCVIYCRCSDKDGNIHVSIVAAKTRVAPLKQISIPRMELCGALLLSRLMKIVEQALHYDHIQTFAWTDSSVVLTWLSDFPRRWKSFVANRVTEILEHLPRDRWNHVISKDNPADVASRGLSPHLLSTYELWWRGPPWLKLDPKNWPNRLNLSGNRYLIEAEQKSNFVSYQATRDTQIVHDLFVKFNSWTKIIRILCYSRRFIRHYRPDPVNCCNNTFLCTIELNQATNICIRWAQAEMFNDEIRDLKNRNMVKARSRLISLSPFLDPEGILRVGGRLQSSSCPYNTKHPIILPKNHAVSRSIILYFHTNYLHPGSSLLINILRQKFWIIGCRSMVKTYANKCITCCRHRAIVTKQLMGNLPQPRVTPSRPFLNVGVDYAGPITIANKKGRGSKHIKAYIAIFICMAVKSMHIELVSELTTDAFLAALKRFIARRGIPSNIYSDNGSNFVGAKRKLSEVYQLTQSANYNYAVGTFLVEKGINWHFIPPAAPNFGGLWESGVKSIKRHIIRVIGESVLTYEEMSTLLCQVEAILNSRPLTPITNTDISNLDVLTPSHFLIGEPLTALPEQNLDAHKISRLTRWLHIQKMVQGFWKRWHQEYLTSLQHRPKWQKSFQGPQIGNIVLIREENLPPTRWLLGRVISLHPGKDGVNRVVTIKTQRGELKRPINKVCQLPVD